jgi:CTP synthase
LPSPYETPILFAQQKFDELILTDLELPQRTLDISGWTKMIEKVKAKKEKTVNIAIVGKYFSTGDYQLRDSYAALIDAIDHAAWFLGINTQVKWIQADKIEKTGTAILEGVDGIIVPIGWGSRGVEGKIQAIEYSRVRKIPYLGLCYGMQLAVVEFARNVLGLKDAHTVECNENTKNPVIHRNLGQEENVKRRAYGGTMRLGRWECKIKKDTITDLSYKEYKGYDDPLNKIIGERHRHRYEFNNEYTEKLEKGGLVIAGRSVVENLVEIIELPRSVHPFFVGTQYHPEYRSRPLSPHPLFIEFLKSIK